MHVYLSNVKKNDSLAIVHVKCNYELWLYYKLILFDGFQTDVLKAYFGSFRKFDITGLCQAGY